MRTKKGKTAHLVEQEYAVLAAPQEKLFYQHSKAPPQPSTVLAMFQRARSSSILGKEGDWRKLHL